MSDDGKVPLPNLEDRAAPAGAPLAREPEGPTTRIAGDLEAVFDVPVQVSAVLGRARMDINDLLKLGPGTVLELDRKVGEAIDIYVNNRLVARGEVVLVEEKLGVTMTEIIKAETQRDAVRLTQKKEQKHAALDRRHAQRPAHHRDQDRDGQGRDRHPRGRYRPSAGGAALGPRRRSVDGRCRASISAIWWRALEAEHIHVPIVACGTATDARAAVAAIHAGAKEYIPLPPDRGIDRRGARRRRRRHAAN